MSRTAAEKKNREDIDRQLEMLAQAYRNAGKAANVALFVDESSTRGYAHYRLTVNGFEVTSWVHVKTADVWLALIDMRRAVEMLEMLDAR